MSPEELLEMFQIDYNDGSGGTMFCLLVYLMIDGVDPDHRDPGMDGPHAIAEICKAAFLPRPAVYARMKKALAPIFEAEPETLQALGIRPQKTTVGLAREVIRSMKGGGK